MAGTSSRKADRPVGPTLERRAAAPANPGATTAPRRHRRVVLLGRGLVAAVVVVAVWVLVTALLFVWPRSSHPSRADAVVVPSGDHGERLATALRLIREGVTRTLVIDGSPDFAEVIRLCQEPQTFEVICLRPDPDTTRTEAQAAGELAERRGWKSVVLVTTTHHLTRAGLLFSRCIEGTVHKVGAEPPYGWRLSLRQIPHEWLGLAHAVVLARSC